MSPSPRRIRLAAPMLRPQAIPPSNRGKALEGALIRACELYSAQGRAHVRRIPEPRVYSPKAGQPIFLAHGIPDFLGVLGAASARRGQAVAFDAKQTREARILLDADHLRAGQASFLRAYADAGAISGLVVRLRAGHPAQSEWWLPWGHVEDALSRGWASIPEDHLQGRGWRLPRVGGAVMWMDRLPEVSP